MVKHLHYLKLGGGYWGLYNFQKLTLIDQKWLIGNNTFKSFLGIGW